MNIAENVQRILHELPDGVHLVAAAKTRTPDEILQAIQAGVNIIGENYVQEAEQAHQVIGDRVQWHFIGHLQTNKVRQVASFISYIESIDSLKLLLEVNKEAQKNNRMINCLLQFHIASEETKFGLNKESARCLLDSKEFSGMRNIRISGVMGMATFCDDPEVVRMEFRMLKLYFTLLKQEYFMNSPEFREISMGMSGDYRIAIEEGSTMVRIGSAVFGERIYS